MLYQPILSHASCYNTLEYAIHKIDPKQVVLLSLCTFAGEQSQLQRLLVITTYIVKYECMQLYAETSMCG